MQWYEINNPEQIDTPAILVFPDRVQFNIDHAIARVGNVDRLRPHIKTHKSPDVTRMSIQSGITKFKCATIAEAELLGTLEAKDVLIAYPLIGPKLERYLRLVHQFPNTEFSSIIDHMDGANQLENIGKRYGVKLNAYIDIDPGMHRTGIALEKATDLLHALFKKENMIFKGFHFYDGHIRDQDFKLRKVKSDTAYGQLQSWINTLNLKMKYSIICGGSPTFPCHSSRMEVECSPGTFVYWDKGYATVENEVGFIPAAVIIARVISKPGDDLVCLDLGHKSVAAENDILHRVSFLDESIHLMAISQSEEHLVLKADDPTRYQIGDLMYMLPYHICPTIALHDRVNTVKDHHVTGHWFTTARDRYIHI